MLSTSSPRQKMPSAGSTFSSTTPASSNSALSIKSPKRNSTATSTPTSLASFSSAAKQQSTSENKAEASSTLAQPSRPIHLPEAPSTRPPKPQSTPLPAFWPTSSHLKRFASTPSTPA